MKMGLLQDQKNTNLEDQEESLLGSASNDQSQLKMNLRKVGFRGLGWERSKQESCKAK